MQITGVRLGPDVPKDEPGGVREVVAGDVTIPITDAAMREALTPLDTNGDGRVSYDDVQMANAAYVVSEAKHRALLHEAVSSTLQRGGFITWQQREGLERFLQLTHDVARARWAVGEWQAHRTDSWGWAMQFESKAWEEWVLPFVVGSGVLSPQGPRSNAFGVYGMRSMRGRVGIGLSAEMYAMMAGLQNIEEHRPLSITTQRMFDAIPYDRERIPSFLAQPVADLVASWKVLRASLVGDGLFDGSTQLECEGDGCREPDELGLFLAAIEERTISDRERTACGCWGFPYFFGWTCSEEDEGDH